MLWCGPDSLHRQVRLLDPTVDHRLRGSGPRGIVPAAIEHGWAPSLAGLQFQRVT